MRIVAGLGNPGEPYSETRHNVGFAVVREVARRWRFEWHDERQLARLARGRMIEQEVTLIEPELYMNRSGEALAALDLGFEAADLIVAHDEMDLPVGRIQVKIGGGTAGHRGIESIVRHYGPDFVRIRVGVGKPSAGADAVEYVLARFESSEEASIASAIGSAADAVECVLEYGGQEAMSRFNVRQPIGDVATSSAAATKA
jgi:PTH1 family peptidyl-tRNA hydrolase